MLEARAAPGAAKVATAATFLKTERRLSGQAAATTGTGAFVIGNPFLIVYQQFVLIQKAPTGVNIIC
jgi:hypothetical protein